MRQLALKKKESRLLWQILMHGIVAIDRMRRKAAPPDQDDYKKLRRKVIDAWKSGLIVGGIRPKSKVYDIMPTQILRETELAELKKRLQGSDRPRSDIATPKKRPTHSPPITATPDPRLKTVYARRSLR